MSNSWWHKGKQTFPQLPNMPLHRHCILRLVSCLQSPTYLARTMTCPRVCKLSTLSHVNMIFRSQSTSGLSFWSGHSFYPSKDLVPAPKKMGLGEFLSKL